MTVLRVAMNGKPLRIANHVEGLVISVSDGKIDIHERPKPKCEGNVYTLPSPAVEQSNDAA